ncbi:hypothetical protein F5Y15DRAFT_385489 [Xylariaceae sp. FL0016]|nr:hypothetical protein F5Y15DRAFT_385489 [Xylariaceae sp. FL0016]
MEQQPPAQIQSELENFREQWRAEVSARVRNPPVARHQGGTRASQLESSSRSSRQPPRKSDAASSSLQHKKVSSKSTALVGQVEDDEDYVPAPSFDEPDASKGGQRLDGEGTKDKGKEHEPKTALDYYEHAVERESTGKLGDSLQLYRKAFRMDDRVDRTYRDKHYAQRWQKPAPSQANPSNASPTVPNTAHHSLEDPTPTPDPDPDPAPATAPVGPLSFPDLIASFAALTVEGAPPECEGMDPPPCPIAALPEEIIVHILRDVAIADVGDFVRLSQVCKRLAYLVATENQIWRRVCVGSEFGFTGMHHHWTSSITWEPLNLSQLLAETQSDEEIDSIFTPEQLVALRDAQSLATTNGLIKSAYKSWRLMFRQRPRVRFNGCYISTVNYIRAGAHTAGHLTWGSPVHIVTYYRYLRLFRDGTAISLLTTDEPAHVVHHMTREALHLHRGRTEGQQLHLPGSVMGHALKGRWRLSSAQDITSTAEADSSNSLAPQALAEAEGDLYIETEGAAGPKYTYHMELAFKSAGRAAARNNKLVWKGFWSYNRLTDDWAEFTLKNDKAFFFSRVKSYGVRGE